MRGGAGGVGSARWRVRLPQRGPQRRAAAGIAGRSPRRFRRRPRPALIGEYRLSSARAPRAGGHGDPGQSARPARQRGVGGAAERTAPGLARVRGRAHPLPVDPAPRLRRPLRRAPVQRVRGRRRVGRGAWRSTGRRSAGGSATRADGNPGHALTACCHEHSVALALVARVDWRGRVLTGDARFCQRVLCRQVTRAGGVIADRQGAAGEPRM